MTLKSDQELINEFKNGNAGAYNELVRRYQKKVYWIARRMVGDHQEADDIVQDVFVSVFHKLKDFRSESSFFTWIYRITSNMAISAIRRKKIINFVRFDDAIPVLSSITDDRDNPTINLEMKENQTLLEEAIANLPNRQKQVFILRYYEELPYEEISKILNKQISGLKANYFHAVKNIQKFVKNKTQI